QLLPALQRQRDPLRAWPPDPVVERATGALHGRNLGDQPDLWEGDAEERALPLPQLRSHLSANDARADPRSCVGLRPPDGSVWIQPRRSRSQLDWQRARLGWRSQNVSAERPE